MNFSQVNVNLETQTEEIIKIIKLDIEYYPKPKFYSDDYYKDKEIDLKESVTRLFPKKKILYGNLAEKYQAKNNVVILPNKIHYSNFNQGNIGACYFI